MKDGIQRLELEISIFKNLPKTFTKNGYTVEIKDDLAFVVYSEKPPQSLLNNKKYEFTYVGLIHGNEVGGVSVLNSFAQKILKEKIKIPHSILFCIGNLEAGLKGERFLERDLNRSFLSSKIENHEENLAVRIGNLAKDSAYCIDIHQTNQDVITPFLIFYYTEQRMAYARYLDDQIPIITSVQERHKDGSTLDFFCYKNNTLNVTLELGKVGFSEKQQEFGVQFLAKTLNKNKIFIKKDFQNVYKVLETIYWDKEPIVLTPGFVNFAPIKKGQKLGLIGTKDYLSPFDGVILFPKYGDIAKKTKEVYTVAIPVQTPDHL